jgi:hypothetical protein
MNAKHIYPCPVQANCANVTTGCWGECYLQKQQRERAGSVFTTGAPPEQESAGQDNRNVGGPKGDTADPALADPEPGGVEPDCIKCMRDRPDLYGEELAYIDSLTARLREMGEQQCHHGWRGHAPKDGRRIVTPCPACGSHSLFIGEGGHLTCAVLGSDHGPYNGCPEPSVEDAVNNLKQRLEQSERDREALRKDAELLDWLEKNYHASEVDEYAAQGNARWVFSTPLLGSWAPLRARLRAALSAREGGK